MQILKILLILVEVISCLLLIGVILIQRSKSEGMGGLAAGAGMGEQLFGSRAGNVLTRTTIILACLFMGCSTLLAVVYSTGGQAQSVIEKKASSASRASQPITGPREQPAPVAPPAAPGPVAPAPESAPAAGGTTVTLPVTTPAPAPEAPAAPEAAK